MPSDDEKRLSIRDREAMASRKWLKKKAAEEDQCESIAVSGDNRAAPRPVEALLDDLNAAAEKFPDHRQARKDMLLMDRAAVREHEEKAVLERVRVAFLGHGMLEEYHWQNLLRRYRGEKGPDDD